jgi:sn-glycerol 3-phosphate transport system substrate-binding protein
MHTQEKVYMLKARKMLFGLLGVAALMLGMVPAMAQEPTEVKVWIAFTDARLDWAREKALAFNEQFPQYNVVIEGYDNYEALFAATALAFEQGSQPAIVQYFEAATQDALDAKQPNGDAQFKPIVEAIGDRTEINGLEPNFDDIVDAVRDYYTVDGEFASMPWNTSSAIMFSNQEMLDAAGVMEIPTTWAEVEAACAMIMAMEDAPANCITWPNHGWFFEQSVGQQGADLVNNGNGREARATETAIASEAAVAYVSWWKEMADMGYYIYTGVQRDWNGVSNLFLAQDVAMIVYSSSDTTLLTTGAADNGFTAVASFMPHNGDVEYAGNLIGGATLWLTNGLSTEAEDGALTFLMWFSNTENAAEWHQVTGYIAIRKSSVELLESQGWFDELPNARVAGDQLAAATPSSATAGAIVGGLPAIRNEVTGAIEDILVNGTDVTAGLTVAQENANRIVEEYNLLNAE